MSRLLGKKSERVAEQEGMSEKTFNPLSVGGLEEDDYVEEFLERFKGTLC